MKTIKHTTYVVIALLATTLSLNSCLYDKEEVLYGLPTSCITTNVTYNNTIAPIVSTSCALTGCHVQGGTFPILENYTQLKSVVDNGKLNLRVVEQQSMPPNANLNECQIELIGTWIKSGAPNN